MLITYTLTTNKYLDTYANDDICGPEIFCENFPSKFNYVSAHKIFHVENIGSDIFLQNASQNRILPPPTIRPDAKNPAPALGKTLSPDSNSAGERSSSIIGRDSRAYPANLMTSESGHRSSHSPQIMKGLSPSPTREKKGFRISGSRYKSGRGEKYQI
ncbi:hypothetical protein CEXT_193841 [Caerostris extrusa]|uniref:Uncharacterized protein n=1 Tax=Caerostris extrusa TaxID=172846 RepID=A0AAV4UIU5_CAEEX|nr:hypothetical protein CEXT_193841 [Caerostris extrusa]